MDSQSLAFLEEMLKAPSPSGYEKPMQDVVRKFAGSFADDVRTDWHGNVMACVNPGGTPRIFLDGHSDQIGLLVKHIDDKGFVRVAPIGGWDPQMLIGQRLKIWTANGPITGVIARKPIHLLSDDERKKVPEIKDLWIDIGAADGEEVRSLVRIGDPVTLELGLTHLRNGLACAAAMDDKVGVWVVFSALEEIAKQNPEASVFAVAAVQEEIGLRGTKTSAFAIDPHLGIAVDVTHATDCPTIDENQYGRVKVGQGPVLFRGPNVNPVMFEQMYDVARDREIPVQINGIGVPASNDGNALQINRSGVATGIVGIPNRYMHSPVEVISLKDLENASRLISEFCLTVTRESDFTP